MTKDEALKLALEALELEDMACRYEKESTPEHIAKAITAIKQVLALDKMADNARDLGLDYEPHKGLSEHITQATNGRVCIDPVTGDVGIGSPPAQPAVPDAMTSADIQEHIEYVAGWNECRQAMLEMMK
jgi:hypothetical protein